MCRYFPYSCSRHPHRRLRGKHSLAWNHQIRMAISPASYGEVSRECFIGVPNSQGRNSDRNWAYSNNNACRVSVAFLLAVVIVASNAQGFVWHDVPLLSLVTAETSYRIQTCQMVQSIQGVLRRVS